MALSIEQTQQIQSIQAKVLTGTNTLEELKEAVRIMRQDRVAAQSSSTASRTKTAAAKVVVNPADLLANLKLLGKSLASGPVA